jgi:hypothetical protein
MREQSGRQDVTERSGPQGWRGLLAKGTPPLRAAAKRRSQAELGCGAGPRREVYGALAGRLTAKRREIDSKAIGGRKWPDGGLRSGSGTVADRLYTGGICLTRVVLRWDDMAEKW